MVGEGRGAGGAVRMNTNNREESHAVARAARASAVASTQRGIFLSAIRKMPGSTSGEIARETGLDRRKLLSSLFALRSLGFVVNGKPRKRVDANRYSLTWWPTDKVYSPNQWTVGRLVAFVRELDRRGLRLKDLAYSTRSGFYRAARKLMGLGAVDKIYSLAGVEKPLHGAFKNDKSSIVRIILSENRAGLPMNTRSFHRRHPVAYYNALRFFGTRSWADVLHRCGIDPLRVQINMSVKERLRFSPERSNSKGKTC